ncbi:hypothetical protein KFE25_003150 [Diacronema lutheri]|uniref:DUF4604 domain-containing protein n=2 Tax=Diacronema lutheri TaxID=2081491 RepID=A0A8J6C9S1_DIALT|nr:hypothetical protein KFE25_003150 [Diacronema lutheri]
MEDGRSRGGGGGRGAAGKGRGAGGGRGGKQSLTFVKHTPKFVAHFMRGEAAATPSYVERDEREDRDDERPMVVEAHDATVSSKRPRAPPEAPRDLPQLRAPERPDSTLARFREKPPAVLEADIEAAPVAESDPSAQPMIFHSRKKKAAAPKPAGNAPRARKLENQKLLSFDV